MKYKELLNHYANEFKNNDLEEYAATYLLADVLEINPSALFSVLEDEVEKSKLKKYQKYCYKFLSLMPAQYIAQKAYFYNLELYVDKRVLIPRQETEELVEMVLNENKKESLTYLDLCAGSGCIGLAIKSQRSNSNVYVSELSNKAIKVIKKNKDKTNLDINILKGDLLEPFKKLNKDVDIIISNPPYISKDDTEVDESTLLYEPHLALFTNDRDGIEIYSRLFRDLNEINFRKCYLEIGYKQKDVLTKELSKYKYIYEFRKDYSNKDRYLIIEKGTK